MIAHDPDGKFDLDALVAKAKAWTGLVGLDLAKDASCPAALRLATRACGAGPTGYAKAGEPKLRGRGRRLRRQAQHPARARQRSAPGRPSCRPTTTAEEILARNPDGVLLSNGPGDPAATGEYAVPEIQASWSTAASRCSASASATRCWRWRWAAATVKMEQGHHGANHPVKDLTTGKVEIVSMNHGFTVDRDSLPAPVQGDPRLPVRRHQRRPGARPTGRCSRCSTTRRPARARRTRSTCSSASPS